MESLKRLEEAIKETAKELKSLSGSETALKSANQSLEKKRQEIKDEISALENQREEIKKTVDSMASDKEKEISKRLGEADQRMSDARSLEAKCIARNAELERIEQGYIESKEKADAEYEKYQKELKTLKEKAILVQEVISK